MIAHARALIAEHGIEGLSVNEVVRLAGGSKATLAKYFGDRSGLIAAAIAEEAREAMVALHLQRDGLASGSLAESLRVLLTGILRFYLQPGSLALYRAVVAMGAQDRSVAAALYDHGHREIVEAVAVVLRAYAKADGEKDELLRDLAEQMVHAIRAGLHEQALLGLIILPLPEQAIAGRIENTLALVLPGVEAALHA